MGARSAPIGVWVTCPHHKIEKGDPQKKSIPTQSPYDHVRFMERGVWGRLRLHSYEDAPHHE